MSGIDINDPEVRSALLALLGGQDQNLGLHQDSLIGTPGATVGPATAALSGPPQATNYAQNPLATVAEFAAPFGLGAIGSLGLNALDANNTNAALAGQGYPGQTNGLQGFGYGVASLGGLAPGMAHSLGMNTVNEQAIAEINANPQGPADPYSSMAEINSALDSVGYGPGTEGHENGATSGDTNAEGGGPGNDSGSADAGGDAGGGGDSDSGGGGDSGGEAKGGLIRGPGTGTSDSIEKDVSNGEFVATEKAVKRFGSDLYYALNEAAEKGLDLRITLHRPVHHNPFLVKVKPVDHDPFGPPISGARQSEDGHWYVPDPTREGKWAQVGTRH